MSARVDQATHRKLLRERATKASDQERLLSLTLPYAGSWLTAGPCKHLGFRLRPREFRLLARYRLGLPLAGKAQPCPMCPNGGPALLDEFGVHAASCVGTPGLMARHNKLRDALYKLARAGFTADMETANLLADTPVTEGLRPADVLIHSWSGTQALCLDVSVVNPLVPSSLNHPAKDEDPGWAARQMERRKIRAQTVDDVEPRFDIALRI